MVKAKKQAEYHWDKGDVAWSPAPKKKTKEKPKKESLYDRLKKRKEETDKYIDMM